MRVLMLGWEFPPFLTGGLGTACHGLTKALDARDVHVTFVLPKSVDRSHSAHVDLISPEGAGGSRLGPRGHAPDDPEKPILLKRAEFEHARFLAIPAGFTHPYPAGPEGATAGVGESSVWRERGELIGGLRPGERPPAFEDTPPPALGVDFAGDMLHEVERYAHFTLRATRGMKFDVIHAHDWMTYPAGLWIARATGRPLVVHVHSTEFDRSGEHVHQRIYDIERRGMHGAIRVIAVSQLTKNVCVNRYGVPESHVEVVYNGVELDQAGTGLNPIQSKDKIVLYFGRITYQKGPEYFVRAAKRVLEVMDNVKFVVAGSGDLARSMIEMAAHLGIGHKILFTGFLRGNDIKRVFNMADLYVMPSRSEPFGIAPLEAMGHDVPVIISKSSGVSEVLSHALKVDFWDVDDIADKIIAVLRHPPLSNALREHGAMEVRQLTWDGAAIRCMQIYQTVLEGMRHHAMA